MWRKDPWSFGSCSFASTESLEGDRDLLAAPVGERLLFAGEATSAAIYATVDGALASGLREARRPEAAATLPGVSAATTEEEASRYQTQVSANVVNDSR